MVNVLSPFCIWTASIICLMWMTNASFHSINCVLRSFLRTIIREGRSNRATREARAVPCSRRVGAIHTSRLQLPTSLRTQTLFIFLALVKTSKVRRDVSQQHNRVASRAAQRRRTSTVSFVTQQLVKPSWLLLERGILSGRRRLVMMANVWFNGGRRRVECICIRIQRQLLWDRATRR